MENVAFYCVFDIYAIWKVMLYLNLFFLIGGGELSDLPVDAEVMIIGEKHILL